MDKKLRNKVYFSIFRIIILSLLFIFAFGIYGIIAAIILSAVFYMEYKKELERINANLPERDERYDIAKGKGAHVSLFTMIMFTLILFIYTDKHEDQGIGPELPLKTVLMAILLLTISVFMVSVWYFDRRGD